ncbi:MAG: ABC transporter permease, partial [Ruminococcaceae bacterium]|nr:ABC transporter permease [Oscillospiraceae bacterium]
MNKPILSQERTKYLKKKKRRQQMIRFCQIAVLVIFIAQWEITARLGWIDSFILSQPSRIWQTFLNMAQNDLFMHMGVTVYETLVGFLL